MLSRLTRSLAMLLVLTAAAIPAAAQEKLAWKFTPNGTLKYVVNQNMGMEVTVAGNKTTQSIKQTMEMTWSILDTSPGGDAIVGQTIDRINMDFSGSLIDPFKYDSADKAPPTTSMGRRIADSYSKILNQQFQLSMKPTGEITNVKIPETLMDALTTGGNGVLTESMVKQMMTQSSVTLPTTAVSRGQSWTTKQTIDLPYGKMTITSKLTYAGVDPLSGQSVIMMAPVIQIASGEDSAQQVRLNASRGEGRVYFDAERGLVAKSELNLTMDLTVRLNEQQIDQKVDQKLSMVLSE